VETLQVRVGDRLLHRTGASLDALLRRSDRARERDEDVGRRKRSRDALVEALVNEPVALVDVALQVEVPREDLRVLVDRSVDDGGLLRRDELLVELELVRERRAAS
jgi:hypothetical protein